MDTNGDPLTDSSPLISAASSGRLRLVRLLVEGGAQTNGTNASGETALIAACKALRAELAGPETLKLLQFLLQNQADPNAQDRCGRTPLMYTCMQQAGAQVASALLAAGADPCMRDHNGASAVLYAINAGHEPTVQVLLDSCRARSQDVLIIYTERQIDRCFLNIPPPNCSPVSCMSPSEIVLKTGSPTRSEGENVFNFRVTGQPGSSRPLPERRLFKGRISSEPWLLVPALDSLSGFNKGGRRGKRHSNGGLSRKDDDELNDPRGVERSRCREDAGLVTSTPERRQLGQLHRGTLPSLMLPPPPFLLLPNPPLQVPSLPDQRGSSRTSLLPPLLPPSAAPSLSAPPHHRWSERGRSSWSGLHDMSQTHS